MGDMGCIWWGYMSDNPLYGSIADICSCILKIISSRARAQVPTHGAPGAGSPLGGTGLGPWMK